MGLNPPLSVWVVYDHPRDMPERVVARRHEVHAGRSLPTPDVVAGDTLNDVRHMLPPGLHCLQRDPCDDPRIVEVWL